MTSPTSADSGRWAAGHAEVSREDLRALGLALLEVVTGDPQPAAAADERLYAWLKRALAAVPAERGWQLAPEGDGPELLLRQEDDDGARYALVGADGIAALLGALRRARAVMLDSEVFIRMRTPLEVVEKLEERLRAASP
jgi:hypothetical protein